TSGTTKSLYVVWGTSSASVRAFGSDATSRSSTGNGAWSGGTLAGSKDSMIFSGAWGSASNNMYVVGGDWNTGRSVIYHQQPGGYAYESGNVSGSLLAIWGSSSADVYAAGVGGAIVHSNGSAT